MIFNNINKHKYNMITDNITFFERIFFSDEIAEYFGVKIAMYFAWLGHYTQSLTVPAVVGFVFWVNLIF